MDQAEKKRKLLIGGALIATLIAIVLVDEEDTMIDPVQPVQSVKSSSYSSEKQRHHARNSEHLDVDQLGKRKFNAQAGELFNATSWIATRTRAKPKQPNPFAQARAQAQAKAQEKARKQQAQEKAAATPPPLEFKYLGKVIEGKRTKVFLAQADEYHVVKLGGRINKQYRVDSINDEQVTLTYLPLNAKQTLMINNESAGIMR